MTIQFFSVPLQPTVETNTWCWLYVAISSGKKMSSVSAKSRAGDYTVLKKDDSTANRLIPVLSLGIKGSELTNPYTHKY